MEKAVVKKKKIIRKTKNQEPNLIQKIIKGRNNTT